MTYREFLINALMDDMYYTIVHSLDTVNQTDPDPNDAFVEEYNKVQSLLQQEMLLTFKREDTEVTQKAEAYLMCGHATRFAFDEYNRLVDEEKKNEH